jgi:toxin-antitoxin system PIN domain toxin
MHSGAGLGFDSVCLLDINVLLALVWPDHMFHESAHRWLEENRSRGWATCPHTQLGFLRLSLQPAVVKTLIGFADAQLALNAAISSPEHVFWPMNFGFSDVSEDIRRRIIGHHQLADALLLELAIGNSGKLATFDRRMASLAPEGSRAAASVEYIAE